MTLRGFISLLAAMSMFVHLWVFFLGMEFLPDYLPARFLTNNGYMGAIIGIPYFISNVFIFTVECFLFGCAIDDKPAKRS